MPKFLSSKGQMGFVRTVLLVIASLIFIKYAFDIDVVGSLTTGRAREWLDKIYEVSKLGWQKYGIWVIKVWDYSLEFGKNLADKLK